MSALAALFLVLVLPTMAGTVTLAGQDTNGSRLVSPELRLARGLACGLATWLVGSGLLVRTSHLTGASAWAWEALVAAASLAVLLLPGSRTRVRAVLGPAGRRLAEVGGLTAVVFLPLWYVIVHTSWSPLGSTPWYYYGLAQQVADLGSLPTTSLEFGTSTPFLNDYHLFTTGTAMLLVQQSAGPMAVIITITLVGVVLLALGAATLSSGLGAGRFTALFAVPIAVAAGIGPIRLAAYRPEGFGLGLSLLMVALGIDWLRHREWRSLLAAALLAATLSQVHGIAAVTAGVMVAAAAVLSLARGPRGEQLRRTGLVVAAFLGAVLVAALVFHEASGTVHAGGLVDQGGLGDPTWEFYRAARDEAPSMPPRNLSMMGRTFLQLYDWQLWWVVPAAALAAVGLWRTRREAATRNVLSFTLLSLTGLLAVASVFMLGWQGYVPRRTGASRIVLEMSLLGPPLLAIGLGGAARATWNWRGRPTLSTPRLRHVVLLVVVSGCGMASLVRDAEYYDGQAPSREQLAVWHSIPATSSEVVLANGYTEGFIPDNTGAEGLLDGRAPYTFDTELLHANELLRGAQRFFDDPARHWSFLAENDVSWVVVGEPGSYSLGTGNVWNSPRHLRALDGCRGLVRFAAVDGLTVFRVADAGAQGCAPAR
jgi:hypothetical protein